MSRCACSTNVLEATAWPLPEQQQEAQTAAHRAGLYWAWRRAGDVGLCATTPMKRARFAAELTRVMRDDAYLASWIWPSNAALFRCWMQSNILPRRASRHACRKTSKHKIRQHGIRNSHLLSIAPTGTISLAFADNASNGIEPAFSWFYTRKKRMQDGSTKIIRWKTMPGACSRKMGGDCGQTAARLHHRAGDFGDRSHEDGGLRCAVHRHLDQQDRQRACRLSLREISKTSIPKHGRPG